MKTKLIGLLWLALAGAALAIEPAELDRRINLLADKFEAFQHQPDKRVPAETLRRAQGILLLDRTKAGVGFAYQGGGGVAMVKDPALHSWSPVAFVGAGEASLGFQIGAEQRFFIVLFMTTNSTRMLTDQKFEFSGEARGTAGNDTAGTEAKAPELPSVLVYDDRQGLYGGAAVKGGVVTPEPEANRIYYGQYVTPGEILFEHKVLPSEAGARLAAKIEAYSASLEAGSTAAK